MEAPVDARLVSIDALVGPSRCVDVPVDPVRTKVGPVGPVGSVGVPVGPVGSVDVPVGPVGSNGGPCRCPCRYVGLNGALVDTSVRR